MKTYLPFLSLILLALTLVVLASLPRRTDRPVGLGSNHLTASQLRELGVIDTTEVTP